MATSSTQPKPRRGVHGRWLIAGVIIVIGAILAGLALGQPAASAANTGPTTVAVQRGNLVAHVSGSGTVAAAQLLDLQFQRNGTVIEVLVDEGESVIAGQTLARLDDRELRLQVESAQTALESAQARLMQTREGNTRPEEIKAAEASLASAEAQLHQARAQLQALRDPSASTISTAEYNVRQAEIDLQAQRDNSSANKTKAEQDLQKAVASLTQAQSSYSTALQNWQHVQDSGTDPQNPSTVGSDGKARPNKLNDAQRQQYYDAFVRAEASLRSAEQAVAQAQIVYDNARQQEVANIQQAEIRLTNAQKQLAALQNPTRSELAQRQAGVEQAQASVEQARANLEKLTAGGTDTDIAIQQAAVTQAEQSLEQARLALEDATLQAPFDGIVTAVAIVQGGSANAGQVAVSMLSRDPLHVDLKLSENDVARIQLNQPVELTIDALRDWRAQGSVGYIATAAESSNGVVTYRVRVDFPDADERVKIGMTANLAIEVARTNDVLLVPNTALLPKGAGRVVQMPGADGRSVSEIDVQTGLTDGIYTEIIAGLNEGDRIIATPSLNEPQRPAGFLP